MCSDAERVAFDAVLTSVGSLFGGMDGCAFDDLMGISTQTLLSKPVAGRTVCKYSRN